MASGAASSSRNPANMATVHQNTKGDGENDKPHPDITEIEDDNEEWVSSEEESSEYDTDDPDDPVVKEYDVFITEPSENDLYVLQFIGRPKVKGPLIGREAPTQLRVKPESGYFEVDVPLDIHDEHYDRRKGVELGEAVRKTKNLGQAGGYGPAVGFERSMPKTKKRPGSEDDADADADVDEPPPPPVDDNVDEYLKNFDDANEKGHVLNTTTWGGQVIGREAWKPNYMIGAFRKNELHLTPVTGIVQLRPELHHMEAVKHLEIINDRKQPPDAKGVLPSVKKLTDEPSTADLLKGNASEKWTRMNWIPADTTAAREARENRLYLKDTANARRLETESVEDYMNRYVPVVVGKGRTKPKKKHTGIVS
ncbi:uncharacterized protein EI97DRAFT_405127 [Westerdykella ornata]|uniref:Uncharacterized protein n=1 Tax=Westerdykella ornata TaxID=318751 RepID=A0A6A6JBK4_WESOR|nr:uncharacterized protein EI97DRAFT_405127 [Westerdykella ornata]KAF2273016.1 hypothetical protein EI97DRAFT_405127 [Westerdykella ornata]